LLGRRLREPTLERLTGFFRSIKRDQDLQLIAQCVDALWGRLAPGSGCIERLLAGTPLQSDIDSTSEQCLVARSLCGIEHHLVGRARVPFTELDLADQRLIEKRRIEG
jgi:hypothetical protein